jgi:hypothetical protein
MYKLVCLDKLGNVRPLYGTSPLKEDTIYNSNEGIEYLSEKQYLKPIIQNQLGTIVFKNINGKSIEHIILSMEIKLTKVANVKILSSKMYSPENHITKATSIKVIRLIPNRDIFKNIDYKNSFLKFKNGQNEPSIIS